MSIPHFRLATLWHWLCSLKLAIVLASLVTLLGFGGSLLIPFRPEIFGAMDGMTLGDWLATLGRQHPTSTWWVWLCCALLLLLGVNTACCIGDWLGHLRARWRKTGEYLIHLGFVLILGAYLWGSLAGFRGEGNRIALGQTLAIPQMPGYYLRLDGFDPIRDASGRPVDTRNELTLLKGETVLKQTTVRANHPLVWRGLTVLATSFEQRNDGFLFSGAEQPIALRAGSRVPLPDGGWLRIRAYLPQAMRRADGQFFAVGSDPVNPALRCEITRPGQPPEAFWYPLREPLPVPLRRSGLLLLPQAPLYQSVSILSIHRDPGASLALSGALVMAVGVILAVGSFYSKRAHGDRPIL